MGFKIEFEAETGTGSATATSYATADEFRQYWINRGVDYTAKEDALIMAWLNLAAQYIDSNYQFKGEPVNDAQALAFPRYNVYLESISEYAAYDSVPKGVKQAACYLAAKCEDGDINDVVDEGLTAQTIGPMSKSYARGESFREYKAAKQLLAPYILPMQYKRVN